MKEGDNLLYRLVFRSIALIMIVAALIANIFSDLAADWILLCATLVCVIWSVTDMIIFFHCKKNRYNFVSDIQCCIISCLTIIIGKYII